LLFLPPPTLESYIYTIKILNSEMVKSMELNYLHMMKAWIVNQAIAVQMITFTILLK